MRYGGYDLRKASKSKSPSSHGSLRLKKVQNTACNIVGRFNLKISDSLKILQRQRTHSNFCESPVSFRGSLFEQHGSVGSYRATPTTSTYSISYKPTEPQTNRYRYERSTTDESHSIGNNSPQNYIFGTNLCNFSTHNLLNGKSTIKIINTFKELEAQQSLSDSAIVSNSLQRLKDDRKTIFKELIELSSCDESLEYRLVKDYLEYNTYSEIENDAEFKEYLQRKNYNDILDYLDEAQSRSLTSISSSVARAQSALSKHTLSGTKLLATPKSLHFTGSDTWQFKGKLCQSCRTSVNCNEALKWSTSRAPTTNTTTSCNQTNGSAEKQGTAKRVSTQFGEPNFFANSYKETLKFCQEFFAESVQRKSGFKLPKYKMNTKFDQTNYERVLREFIGAQGFTNVDEYVEAKFGQFFSAEFDRIVKDENYDSEVKRNTVKKKIKVK